jgi:ABC-type glycerol-3-phosphate transport system permease component
MSAAGNRHWLSGLIRYALLLGGMALVVVPFLSMLSTSFKPPAYTLELPPRLIPSQITLDNYVQVFAQQNMLIYFGNSLFVAVISTLGTVAISALMAYAFALMRFPGKGALFSVLLIGMMIPPVMLIIPQFLVAKDLKLLNSLAGLIVVYITMNLSLQTFLLRGVFAGVPRDLLDAALVDGGTQWTLFRRIVLPLSKPGLAVVVIFTFLYSWDEFPWAHVAIQDVTRRTLPVAIALFLRPDLTEWGQVFALSVIALIPVLIVYVVFQRYFVTGVAITGLKG